MLYLERVINYKDGVMLINSPINIYEGDKDIKVEFTITGLDVHFKDKIINYKLALISDNNVLWNEQNTVENGRFILDIPDGLEVCNYSLLIQLIDSIGDSVLTLSIIKDFLIVNEGIIQEEPEEPEEPQDPNIYLIKDGEILSESNINNLIFGSLEVLSENNTVTIANNGDNPFRDETYMLLEDTNYYFAYGTSTGSQSFHFNSYSTNGRQFTMSNVKQYVFENGSLTLKNTYASVYLNTSTIMKRFLSATNLSIINFFSNNSYFESNNLLTCVDSSSTNRATEGYMEFYLPSLPNNNYNLIMDINKSIIDEKVKANVDGIITLTNGVETYNYKVNSVDNFKLTIGLNNMTDLNNIKLKVQINANSQIEINKLYLEEVLPNE